MTGCFPVNSVHHPILFQHQSPIMPFEIAETPVSLGPTSQAHLRFAQRPGNLSGNSFGNVSINSAGNVLANSRSTDFLKYLIAELIHF
jgi:hypothetical protein